jgi:hypothetical protein
MINDSIAPQPDIWAVRQQGGPPVKPSKLRLGLMVRDAQGKLQVISLGFAPPPQQQAK